jgi:hypothetical protein
MRPLRDYPSLSESELEEELVEVLTLLERSMEALSRAKITLHCESLKFYYEIDDSHAARQRFADYNTQTQYADVVEFEQQVAAYRVNQDTLVHFLSWRRDGKALVGASGL